MKHAIVSKIEDFLKTSSCDGVFEALRELGCDGDGATFVGCGSMNENEGVALLNESGGVCGSDRDRIDRSVSIEGGGAAGVEGGHGSNDDFPLFLFLC